MAGLQPTLSSADLLADDREQDQAGGSGLTTMETSGEVDSAELNGNAEGSDNENEIAGTDVDMRAAEEGEDAAMNGSGGANDGKRVKVYELREASWFDRGTGHCRTVYDPSQDLALLIVEAEELPTDKAGEGEQAGTGSDAPGGFLKEDLLLNSRVEKTDIYARQQDTLIVWTEPSSQLDIALSFQDAEGCEDVWHFIKEVQKHFNNQPSDAESQIPSSSSPLSASPMMGIGSSHIMLADTRQPWQIPNLANIKEQETLLRMQVKSPAGRERAVEHIIGEDYIKHLITVLNQAEDLESLEDLHALCSLMQTILMFNDNGIFEYILQDDIFMGVIGMLEYDPEFPTLKASYRQFLKETTKFREVVEIKDEAIRNKIHQTYRLHYLKDVVLARVLDDPTFGILNGFVFYNQVDIISHVQNDEGLLSELFTPFRDNAEPPTPEEDGKRCDIVTFLHQLMHMGKGVQMPNRLALYRSLLDRGLLFVCEWAFKRKESKLLHSGAEMITFAVEHDVNAVRMHVLKEEDVRKTTLVVEIIAMLTTTTNLGLVSQMTDTLRTLLETSPENETFAQRKEGPVSENFTQYFYDNCAIKLFEPLLELPEYKAVKETPMKLTRERATLLQNLIELLSFCVINHAHRSQYFILSNPISPRVVSLLYVKEKPLRHAAVRYVKACLKTGNHFIHRYFVKNDLLLPLFEVLENESTRDNMLSSSCMDVLDLIRKENMKPIINHLFEKYKPRIESLSQRPNLRSFMFGLTVKWEQNNEPPPPPPPDTSLVSTAESKAWKEEEDYFNGSDEEEIGPKLPSTSLSSSSSSSSPKTTISWPKRKRMITNGGAAAGPPAKKSNPPKGPGLGLDYDDASDPDDLDEITAKVRAKRSREEEEEEGFAGLLTKGKEKKEVVGVTATATGTMTPVKEVGKKIRLNLGSWGKKAEGKGKG
ncbi:protein phosphatase 4 regulatory subunit 3, partial [Tremellales sp. Uapishka_1]